MADPKLSAEDIEAIIKRYDRGEGESVPALALAYEVSDQTIRYHLKKRAAYVSDVSKPAADDDLGIGEELDENAAFAALLARPDLQNLIDAAVEARLKQLTGPTPSTQTEDFKAFTETLKHLINSNAMQQPGYIKPIPADELDRRANGHIQMRALLKKFEQDGTPPQYIVGDGGFFECTNAQEFGAGQKIRTYLPPAEDFIPDNAQARQVHAAMMVWIGGETPGIGEQVEAAMLAQKNLPPLVTGAMAPVRGPSKVELVEAERVDVSRKRVAGTIVQERRGTGMGGEPSGPTFVGADAV
jgi:hypothetical protein